ncbi:restriction endonuclease subunit S [Stygiolobus sp. CP850M]|uniref:restriction endonuclease subunit S n=1 Tax=Stygiolobus sp. CP850M TaxID=3133134 RepID=UPI00307CDBF1
MTEYETEFSEFPKEWEVKRLSEIAELQRGLSYSGSEKSKDEIPDGYLFLTLNSVKEGGGLKEDGWTWIKSDRLKERHFVREGDIVIANTEQSKDGSLIGSPAIVHFPELYKKDKAVFSHHISKLLLKVSNLDVNFLFYYLSFVQPLARKYHTGTGVWGLNVDSWAKDLLVPIPPLEEQKKIVEILNTVDFIITDTTNLIEKLRVTKEKTLNLLITGKIWHKEFEDTEIGKIPKNWEVKKLKDIIIYRKGIKPKELYIKKVNDNYLPYLTAEYLRGESEPKYVNPNENKIIVAEPEDILMIWDGSGAGDLFIGFKGIVASTFVCIKCNKNIIYPKYLYYYLLKKAETLKQRTKGTGIPHINKETFENLLVPIPPLEEQKKIVEILSTIDNKIETETKYLDYMKKLKEKLLAALMTGKIRVNSIAIGDLR